MRCAARSGGTRYEKIVAMIEEPERLKSSLEGKAAHLADKLVPMSFLGTVLTGLLTRNVQKTVSILMVDFSCALKLSMPLAVLSAMRECSRRRITVKGGRFLEALAEADTVVFDKTGTLTKAQPTVREVVTFRRRAARRRCCAWRPAWKSIFRTLLPAPWCAVPPRRGWSTRRCIPA